MLPWLPCFPPKAFSNLNFLSLGAYFLPIPILSPLGLSPCSHHQSSLWDCCPIPMPQLPAAAHSCEHVSLSVVCRAATRIVCVWFSLHSVCCRSATSLFDSFKLFPSVPTKCPGCRDLTFALGPHIPQVQVWPCSLSSFFHFLPFILLSFVWIYIFPSGSKGLLWLLSWCSVRTSASENVFLMHP